MVIFFSFYRATLTLKLYYFNIFLKTKYRNKKFHYCNSYWIIHKKIQTDMFNSKKFKTALNLRNYN